MDPRVKTPATDLEKQFLVSMQCYEGLQQIRATRAQTRRLREQLKTAWERDREGNLREAIGALDRKVADLEGNVTPRGRPDFIRSGDSRPTLARLSGDLGALMSLVQGADVAPTTQAMAAVDTSSKALGADDSLDGAENEGVEIRQ